MLPAQSTPPEGGEMSRSKPARCAQCAYGRPAEDLFLIDGSAVCRHCLFGGTQPVTLYPIGFVSNTQARDDSEFGLHNHTRTSRIDLFPSQKRFMYKLEEESHLTIVYYLHKARPIRSRFKRGLDGKEVGVFASRTPDRLSPIGIQDVLLRKVEETTLTVEGLDAIDGTPVLDIKLRWHRE
jgi:tRNA (adenine37-N6)-methyltransferase